MKNKENFIIGAVTGLLLIGALTKLSKLKPGLKRSARPFLIKGTGRRP